MKISTKYRIIVVLLALSLLLASCGSATTKLTETKTANVGTQDVVVGDIERDGIEVFIPAGALPEDTEFSLQLAQGSPEADAASGMLLDTPYELEIKGDIKRFDRPVQITFQLTKEQWQGFENPGDAHIAYYDGDRWVYLKPSAIDAEKMRLTFTTYHCSFLSPATPTKDEMKKQVAHDMAVQDVTIDKDEQLRQTTETLVKSVMGPNVDKSLLRDIVEGIMDQNDFTQFAKAAANQNTEEMTTQFISCYTTVTANTLWAYAKNADDLGGLGLNLELVGAFGNSAALIAEGDFQAAAEELAKGVIQTNPIGKLLLTAVNVTNRQIARWKNEEIEAAYKIYLNGKEPTIAFWGYGSIEAGDFEEIWNQMRGIGRQIIIDAVADFEAENGREPTEAERKQIEADAKSTLEREFQERKLKEEAIAEAERKNLDFLAIMEDGNLMTSGRYGYDALETPYEQRVQQILELRNKVLTDTKRKMNFGGDDTETEINVHTVWELIAVYTGQGEEAYNQLLVQKGYMEGFDITKVAGTYPVMLQFQLSTLSETDNSTERLSIYGSASVSNSEASITITADGTASLSLSVSIQASQKNSATYSEGYVHVTNDSATYLVEELYTGIAIKTSPGATTIHTDILGDRFLSGTETYERVQYSETWDVTRSKYSGHLGSLTAKIVDSQLIISGSTQIMMPVACVSNLGSQGFPATFELVVSSEASREK